MLSDFLRDPRALLRSLGRGAVDMLGAPSATPTPGIGAGDRESLYLVRDGYSVQRIPTAQRRRRDHICNDLGDLARTLQRLANPHTPAIADVLVQGITLRSGRDTDETVSASLDPTNPDGDRICYGALLHARWKHWERALGKELTAAQFRELVLIGDADTLLIEDKSGRPVLDSEGKQCRYGSTKIASQLKSITVGAAGEKTVDINDLGMIVAKSVKEAQTLSAQIPASFLIELPLVQDLDIHFQVAIRVSAAVTNNEVRYTLSAPYLADVEHQVRVAIRDRLRAALGEGWSVALGIARTAAYCVPYEAPAAPEIHLHAWARGAPVAITPDAPGEPA